MFGLGIYDRLVVLFQRLDFLPPLLARVIIGGIFITAGWGKLHNLEKVIEYFQSLNIPAASIQAPFAAACELVFGITVLIGLFTRISTIPLMGIMAVAIMTAKKNDIVDITSLFGFSEFLYIALLLWLFIRGAGLISIDRILLGITGRKEAGNS